MAWEAQIILRNTCWQPDQRKHSNPGKLARYLRTRIKHVMMSGIPVVMDTFKLNGVASSNLNAAFGTSNAIASTHLTNRFPSWAPVKSFLNNRRPSHSSEQVIGNTPGKLPQVIDSDQNGILLDPTITGAWLAAMKTYVKRQGDVYPKCRRKTRQRRLAACTIRSFVLERD